MAEKRTVYLDYSATTPVKDEVLKEMIPWFSENYGNPSSIYSMGQKSKEALDLARSRVASLIGADPKEIFFTSTGTEADNWALFGVFEALKAKGNHIISSNFEHHAVLHGCQQLEKRGAKVTYLPVNSEGLIDPKDVEAAITDKTILISLMMVNNEIGTVQPIKEIAQIAKKHGVLLHTDAIQAVGNLPVDVKDLGVDMLSLSAHKIYGPKGVGALYIRKGLRISNFMHGGGQEGGKRSGTENLAGIIGFGKAAELSKINFESHVEHVSKLRDYFLDQVMKRIHKVDINGSLEFRHPGNISLAFDYIEGEGILILLDQKGIAVSTGSACNSASLNPSHVLSAIGLPIERVHGTIRFTMGDLTTQEDVDYVLDALVEVVEKLRSISSVSEKKGWS